MVEKMVMVVVAMVVVAMVVVAMVLIVVVVVLGTVIMEDFTTMVLTSTTISIMESVIVMAAMQS